MVYISTVALKHSTFGVGDICPAHDWKGRVGLINRGRLVVCEESEVVAVQHRLKTDPPRKVVGKRGGVKFVRECVLNYVPPKKKKAAAKKKAAPKAVAPVAKPKAKSKPKVKAAPKPKPAVKKTVPKKKKAAAKKATK